ncbi:MAG: hypothetical protein ACYC61_23895 [Isosphaeraceae bacterium]
MLEATHAVRLNLEGRLSSNPWFDLDVVIADPATSGVDVLIGMDVLSRLVLFDEGANGTLVLAD